MVDTLIFYYVIFWLPCYNVIAGNMVTWLKIYLDADVRQCIPLCIHPVVNTLLMLLSFTAWFPCLLITGYLSSVMDVASELEPEQ